MANIRGTDVVDCKKVMNGGEGDNKSSSECKSPNLNCARLLDKSLLIPTLIYGRREEIEKK